MVLAHVALQRGVAELGGRLIAGLLGEGDAGGGEADAVPRQEHGHREHDRAERRDQEPVSGTIAGHRPTSSARSPAGLIASRIYRLQQQRIDRGPCVLDPRSDSPGSALRNPTGISLRSATLRTIRSPSAKTSAGTAPPPPRPPRRRSRGRSCRSPGRGRTPGASRAARGAPPPSRPPCRAASRRSSRSRAPRAACRGARACRSSTPRPSPRSPRGRTRCAWSRAPRAPPPPGLRPAACLGNRRRRSRFAPRWTILRSACPPRSTRPTRLQQPSNSIRRR